MSMTATASCASCPLGGLGEIGKNMTVVEYDGAIVVVDTGLRFPTAEMVGIDLVLPDFTYLRERADDIEGIVITHGHEDHLGALPWVLRELGTEHPGLRRPADDGDGALQARRAPAARTSSSTDVKPGETLELGPFDIELIHMTHSIPDAIGRRADDRRSARCSSPATTSSTRRPVDGKPGRHQPPGRARPRGRAAALRRLDQRRPPRLVARASRSSGPHLEAVFARCEGRIVVTCFASNIHRVQQVVDAAAALGRKVALVGRSMRKNIEHRAHRSGHIDVPEGMLDPAARDRRLPRREARRSSRPAPRASRSAPCGGWPTATTRRSSCTRATRSSSRATPIPGNERAVNETSTGSTRSAAT